MNSFCRAIPLGVVLFFGVPGLVHAQPSAPQVGAGDGTGNDPSRMPAIQRHYLETVLGREVRTQDKDGGRIIDVLVDKDGKIRGAVIEFGGFLGIGTRKIAVDWKSLNFESGARNPGIVGVDLTRDQLRRAPEYKPTQPVMIGRVSD